MKTTVAWLALGLGCISSPLAAAPIIVTQTFQQGAGGYTGSADRRITANGTGDVDGSAVDTDVNTYFLDGGASALNDTGASQGLLRFDNIVGGGIPAGAKVVSATVDVVTTTTAVNANSQSGGAYNIYTLATPFDSTSTWASPYGGDGLAGDVGPILGSFDDLGTAGAPSSARVDKAVQNWADGAANLGVGIRSDRTTDGWSVNTTGAATVANRPRLTVNYTVDPLVEIKSYQNGVNGYAGSSDLGLNPDQPGSTVQNVFVDGFSAEGTGSPDQPYLLQFDGIDTAYQQIHRAELIIKTGFASSAADSPGPFTVHQMLTDWSPATTYASLDSNGDPAVNDANELLGAGTIGPAAASVVDINDTEVMYIDVTSIVESWRSGAANHGFYIGTTGTSNGWQLFTTGATDPSFRPELRIIGVQVPEPASLALLAACVVNLSPPLRRRAASGTVGSSRQ